MYVINIYAIFFHDKFQIWASRYNILEEETKQPLDMAINAFDYFYIYDFVEKSIRNDLELVIGLFPSWPSTPWTGIGYNIDCFA